jgi:hypothetical protein
MRGAGFAAAMVVAMAGCTPPAPALSDPREILGLAVGHLRDAKAVHVDAAIDGMLMLGSIVPGLPLGGSSGGNGSGGALALTGTRVEGDLDLVGERADLHLEVPALLGLTAEVREVGGAVYVTSSLTGGGWRRLDDESGSQLGSWRPMAWVGDLQDWLARPGIVPIRLDDAACPAGTCYVVRVTVDGANLLPRGPLATGSLGLEVDQLTLDLRIDRTTLRLSQVVVSADLGEAGKVEATVSLSGWDAGVTIEAPPPGDVQPGPVLP